MPLKANTTGVQLFEREQIVSGVETAESKDRSLAGLGVELGIKPTTDNINFLDSYSRTLCKNMELLYNMLLEDGNTAALKKLQKILLSYEKLGEYLKNFNEEIMKQQVDVLRQLFDTIKNNNPYSKEYSRVLSDILKGFSIQINHQFPLFFIPVPLFFNNKLYPGEIWIEKDPQKTENPSSPLSIFILLDTPLFGRIEGLIKSADGYINVDLYCKKEIVPVFNDNIELLKERLSTTGIVLKSLGIHELKGTSSFKDLVQKYVHPYPSVDLKI